EEIVVLALADVDAAPAAADDHAGVGLADGQPCIHPRFASRDDADEGSLRIALRIGPVAGVPDVVARDGRDIVYRHARDLCGHLTPEVGGVETSDRPGAAATSADRIPKPFAAHAK